MQRHRACHIRDALAEQVRAAGSIARAVEQGLIRDGIMPADFAGVARFVLAGKASHPD